MELTTLSRSDTASDTTIKAVAGVLTRAFHPDPGTCYIMPDPLRRAEIAPSLLEVLARYALSHGQIWLATEEAGLVGVALWLPPEHPTFREKGMLEAGIVPVAEQAGDEVMGRLATLTGHTEALREALMSGPHWYLAFLAVEPTQQGKGIGSRLLEEMAPQTQGLPCYLETFNTRNVVLYKRHGFRVVGEGDIPEGGPHYWAMRCS